MVIPATERGSKGYSTDQVVSREEAERIRSSLYQAGQGAPRGRVLESLPERLSAEDVEFFATHGYLAANGLLTPDEIQQCTDGLSDLVRRKATWDTRVWSQEEPYFAAGGEDERAEDAELRLRKLAYFVQMEPGLDAAARHPRLMAAVHQLIGDGARLIQDMALLKPPFRGSEKPRHQDAAAADWTPLGNVLGTWLALDEATVKRLYAGDSEVSATVGRAFSRARLSIDDANVGGARGDHSSQTWRCVVFLGLDPSRHAREPHRTQASRAAISLCRGELHADEYRAARRIVQRRWSVRGVSRLGSERRYVARGVAALSR
jgi:hypothetical protein